MSIKENIDRIKQDIEKYKTCEGDVLLLGVTKGVSSERIREAYDCGIRDFGENYLQEAINKMDELRDLPLRWHFIGHLQTNKAGKVAERFSLVQSVDKFKLAHALNDRVKGKVLDILLQIDFTGRDNRTGFNPAHLEEVEEILKLPHVKVRGLMSMAPFLPDPEDTRPYFRKVKDLAIELKEKFGFEANYLSMGMTGDYKVALSEGANLIRIGSGIFGPRTY